MPLQHEQRPNCGIYHVYMDSQICQNNHEILFGRLNIDAFNYKFNIKLVLLNRFIRNKILMKANGLLIINPYNKSIYSVPKINLQSLQTSTTAVFPSLINSLIILELGPIFIKLLTKLGNPVMCQFQQISPSLHELSTISQQLRVQCVCRPNGNTYLPF